ncbi:hypothetical protein VF21_08287 [Pseudogymnoascus sp. 05NY08]|nr:hypothetical protein VF21_08287 [Pseudogymnoascus sp. 05NY08]OBT90052.1 hypothetical protein VE02_02518 [Pseudogymnoascus sp. 03VT05]
MTTTTQHSTSSTTAREPPDTAVTSSASSSPASPRRLSQGAPPATDSDAASSASTATRPKIGTRKSSGTIIVPRDAPNVELKKGEEVFDEDDARAMSPRRNSEDLEKMSQEARAQLSQHAKLLQESLLEIFNRIEAVKEEHDKLDSNNKFLQKYIGDLMSTTKITATGSGNRKK